MQDPSSKQNDFLMHLTEVIEQQLSNENFGVSELASELGMSRSNLLRKTKQLTKLSASQFIRQVRLKKALDLLRKTSHNVSEVSYKVGFGSTSYFIKCFREFYGYPPGEVGKRPFEADDSSSERRLSGKKNLPLILVAGVLVVAATVLCLIVWRNAQPKSPLEKSIAVLPFKNDSSDSSNVYLINGLMESTLNNLQKIQDLRVISRTSVEKYRSSTQSIPDIGTELHVSYFVEGSGQKIGNKILLNIQLIEAATDRHLWARQYSREAQDIFQLQQEIAKDIANEVEVIITPEEEERIDNIPTHNLVAYDYYLQGLELLKAGNTESSKESIDYFQKAIDQDSKFAIAYADIAIAYYLLDIYRAQKEHTSEINNYADKALLLDPKAPESLIAKGMYYLHTKEYKEVTPYLEKALEYAPNSATIINMLSDFYATRLPNTAKYLEYALKGIQLDIGTKDSATTSNIYLHLSNALIQSGFVDEALHYADLSLAYNPNNYYTLYVKIFILHARDQNIDQTTDLLQKELNKDTSRADLFQEMGKLYFFKRNFPKCITYYKKFIDLREAYQLNIYRHEHLRIGAAFAAIGQQRQAQDLFDDYKNYLATDKTIYQNLGWTAYHAYFGETKEALQRLERFSTADHIQYWIILFLEADPLIDNIKNTPKFKALHEKIQKSFWRDHDELETKLKDQGLI